MKSWKVKVLSGALALSVLVPTASLAADAQSFDHFAHHQQFDQAKHKQMQAELLDLVTQYTPSDLAQWKTALAEREKLITELRAKQPIDKQRPQLSDETREKVKAIHEDMKNGKLTQEQAKEEMKKLGFKDKGLKGFDKNNLRMQLGEAVKANDEAKIKELLPQMLKQMQERNKQITEKLANTKN